MTRAEIAAFYGIPLNTVHRRIWLRWPIEQVIKKKIKPVKKIKKVKKRSPRRLKENAKRAKYTRPGRTISPWGIVSMQEIADHVGISISALFNRLYELRWSREDAFNTPFCGKPGIDFIMPPEEYQSKISKVKELNKK